MTSVAMPVARRRFTVEEYERMAQVGILGEHDRVELLEGEIVEMALIGAPHAGCVNRLIRLFATLLGDRVVVSAQNPLRLGQHSEPQPDLALLRPRPDFYSARHPEPDDVLLVIEVSSSSAAFDRLVKLPLYARAGVRQAWLVDLDTETVEVHRPIATGTYGDPQIVQRGERVVVDAFPDAVLTAADVLG